MITETQLILLVIWSFFSVFYILNNFWEHPNKDPLKQVRRLSTIGDVITALFLIPPMILGISYPLYNFLEKIWNYEIRKTKKTKVSKR